MITTVKADGVQEYAFIETLKKRAQNSDTTVIAVVAGILQTVPDTGDEAEAREFARRLGIKKFEVFGEEL